MTNDVWLANCKHQTPFNQCYDFIFQPTQWHHISCMTTRVSFTLREYDAIVSTKRHTYLDEFEGCQQPSENPTEMIDRSNPPTNVYDSYLYQTIEARPAMTNWLYRDRDTHLNYRNDQQTTLTLDLISMISLSSRGCSIFLDIVSLCRIKCKCYFDCWRCTKTIHGTQHTRDYAHQTHTHTPLASESVNTNDRTNSRNEQVQKEAKKKNTNYMVSTTKSFISSFS